jgi:undecaprenyl diphosphate synthase
MMQEILEKIDKNNLPKHVAIIMDGNGRWAKSRGEERTFGHKNAISAVRNAISACNKVGVEYLTLYTFSTENWNRPNVEVDTLMSLLSETLLKEAAELFSKGVRLHVIGEVENLPTLVREQLLNVVELTKKNSNGNLVLALSYGSLTNVGKFSTSPMTCNLTPLEKSSAASFNNVSESKLINVSTSTLGRFQFSVEKV